MSKLKNYAIILASGTGSRFGGNIPKQFEKIKNKTILEYSIGAFDKNDLIDEVIVVVNFSYLDKTKDIIKKANFKKVSKVVEGGKLRKDSSRNGVFSISDNEANVLIHDCARPLVSQRIINDCICALDRYNAVNVAVKSTDTVIEVSDNIIKSVPNRENLRCCQTPQCFKLSIIKKAHELSMNDDNFSDDCGLILKHNLADIFVVDGDTANFKITYQNDIFLAEKILGNV